MQGLLGAVLLLHSRLSTLDFWAEAHMQVLLGAVLLLDSRLSTS